MRQKHENGLQENNDGQFIEFAETEVNNPEGPLHKWDKGTIKEFLRKLSEKGSQSRTITDWYLTLKSFTPWSLDHIIIPVLKYCISHSLIQIGLSEVGKSPVQYTTCHLLSAFWVLQEGSAGMVPSFQIANNLDHFRQERGRRTKPRGYDDGNLPSEQPAALKAVTEVSGLDRLTIARWTSASYESNQFFP